MGVLKEFREFAVKGSVIDMAVALLSAALRQDRHVAGQRHHHAAYRNAVGPSSLFRPFHHIASGPFKH